MEEDLNGPDALPAVEDVDVHAETEVPSDQANADEYDGLGAASLHVHAGRTHTNALLPEIVQASLSSLGHAVDGSIVFTTLTLSSLNLGNIDMVSQYPYLQKVLLDQNALTSLAALSEAKSLVVVSASHNNLNSGVFADLAASSETLEQLNLSDNQFIEDLNGLQRIPFLRILQLEGCGISAIKAENFSSLQSLSTLNLARNKIDSIEPTAFAECPIRHLNLRENHLNDLSSLQPLSKTISLLDASDNNVMHFSIVSSFAKLRTFYFAGNNAYDIEEVSCLAELELLRVVSLIGNPLCSLHPEACVLDDDLTSDIVQPDEPATDKKGRRSSTTNDDDQAPAGRSYPRNTTRTATKMFKNEEDALAALNPQEENKIEFFSKSRELQFRLKALWRAPGITVLDDVPVSPEELADAHNLEGGTDRVKRSDAKKKYFKEKLTISAGTAASALRAGRGQL